MSVVVVGAGPTGLMLAGDLAEAGVPVTVLEKRAHESNLTRAFAVHARTLELLDMRGLADGLVSQGVRVPEVRPHFDGGEFVFDMRHPDSRFPYVLVLQQARTEALLEHRARELGVDIVRGAEVTGLRQGDDAVTLSVAGRPDRRADFVVGCDGAHSAVRRLLGVGFSGRSYDTHILLADVRLVCDLPLAVNPFLGRDGAVLLPPYGDGWYRATIWDRTRDDVPMDEPVTFDEVRASLQRIAGPDVDVAEMRWSTRFLSERRQAECYRVGRVFLAGDAAHVHSPLGAMGMSTGIQDAANLSWKLAAAHAGWAPPWLLDTYHAERHAAGRSTLRLTDMLVRLAVPPLFVRLIRPYLAPAVINRRRVSTLIRETMSGLGVAYDVPARTTRSPLVGQRAPDLPMLVRGRRTRLFEQVRPGRFLLLDVSDTGAAAAAGSGWAGRVEVVRAEAVLPRGGTALLLRPDGYVAWSAARPSRERVVAVLNEWCGPVGAIGPNVESASKR
jgi:2-polyprenyl-6-methoxyphenol hydroxylase-like FAD-dependent oxidoreductase